MRRLWSLLAVVLSTGISTSVAFATPELSLVSGSSIVAVSSGLVPLGNGQYVYSTAVGGWNVSIFGTSQSPSLEGDFGPLGLELYSITATCQPHSGCSSNPLTLEWTDTGFTQVVPGFQASYTANSITGGSATQTAFEDAGDNAFGTTTQIGAPITVSSGNGTGVVYNDVGAGPDPYSLTIEDVFTATDPGTAASFTTTGIIAGTPEPMAVVLLGTVFLFVGTAFRRKKAS